ncbi:G5 domain-containing protein [Bacillus suaedaesalsae]|uniref:G5 domain-containing protein n=1 Tax=Bacillus suaedaesalsae TaxID=2810349 RepID=A0ABS2DMN2_9BACI|nr:G5 domain-containing protein [Bacillus suaedaesalsae]MBM6619762.1 G5 domain-containing protein [Bacillus suaedaesalsae]
MRKSETVHVFLILFVGVIFILGFSRIGAITFDKYSEDIFEVGTIIGNVDVSGITQENATEILLKEFNRWKSESTISILIMEEEKIVPNDTFTPNFTESVHQAGDGETSPLAIDINDKLFEKVIQALPEDIPLSDYERGKLKQDILEIPSTLQYGQFSFDIYDYVSAESAVSIIAEETIKINSVQAAELTGEVGENFTFRINGASQISLLDELSSVSEEHLNMIGTVLYKAILSTNFQVLERHISKQAPEQSIVGYETKMKRDEMDFIFYNPNKSEYVAHFTIKDSEVTVQIKGVPLLNEYSIELTKKSFNPKSIVQMDPKLSIGSVRMIEKGEKGYLIKVTRSKKSKNGEVIDKELMAEDFYPPVHQVILSSVIPKDVPEEEIEETDEESNNPELEQVIEDNE